MTALKPRSNVLAYRSHIMLFSALWILCCHSVSIMGTEQWTFLQMFKPLIAFGWGGVDIFLFLSGLGIGLSLSKRPQFNSFFSKRFNRIFYSFFIIVTIVHIANQTSTIDYILDTTTLSYWLPLFGINATNSFWYISAAFAFYLLSYPYYNLFFYKKPLLSTIIISLIGLICYKLLFGKIDFFLARIPIYFIGMYSSKFVCQSFKSTPFILLSIIAYSAMSLIAWKFGGLTLSSTGLNFIFFIFITPGLVFLLSSFFKFLDNMKWGKYLNKTFNILGNYSLEIYLVHWGLLCMMKEFEWNINWFIFIGITILISFAVKITSNLIISINRNI